MDDMNNKIGDILDGSLDRIKSLARANIIVGEPISTVGNNTIIPISRAVVGFVVGGGELVPDRKKLPINYPVTGGTGGGFNLVPVGFLVEESGKIRYIPASTSIDSMDKLITLASKAYNLLAKGDKK